MNKIQNTQTVVRVLATRLAEKVDFNWDTDFGVKVDKVGDNYRCEVRADNIVLSIMSPTQFTLHPERVKNDLWRALYSHLFTKMRKLAEQHEDTRRNDRGECALPDNEDSPPTSA